MRKRYVAAVVGALVLIATPVAAEAGTSRSLKVASLGDSYASGTGAGDYQAGTAGTCWRSNNSSAEVNVAALRAHGIRVSLANVACSGATIGDLRQPFKGQPPQLDALTTNTDVVQLTIGASDIEFASYGGLCIQADCSGAPTEAMLARMPALTTSLVTVLGEIRARSPRARIVLVGYGRQLSPAANAGPQLDPICADGVATAVERTDGNRVSTALDDALRAASRTAHGRGVNVTFVSPHTDNGDVVASFAGHALCEAGSPYYRGLEALSPGQEGLEAVLHPSSAGQAALAALVRQRIFG